VSVTRVNKKEIAAYEMGVTEGIKKERERAASIAGYAFERTCKCMVPSLEGAGQHSPACAIFKEPAKDIERIWDAILEGVAPGSYPQGASEKRAVVTGQSEPSSTVSPQGEKVGPLWEAAWALSVILDKIPKSKGVAPIDRYSSPIYRALAVVESRGARALEEFRRLLKRTIESLGAMLIEVRKGRQAEDRPAVFEAESALADATVSLDDEVGIGSELDVRARSTVSLQPESVEEFRRRLVAEEGAPNPILAVVEELRLEVAALKAALEDTADSLETMIYADREGEPRQRAEVILVAARLTLGDESGTEPTTVEVIPR
jgi:hypothetical protein